MKKRMKNVANKKTERKYKLNKTLIVNENVINIKHQIIRLLSFSITIQYGDRLECHIRVIASSPMTFAETNQSTLGSKEQTGSDPVC